MFATVPSIVQTFPVVALMVTLAVVVLDGAVFRIKALLVEFGNPEGAVSTVILTLCSVTFLLQVKHSYLDFAVRIQYQHY